MVSVSKLLVALMLLASVYAVSTESELNLKISFTVTGGGNGDIAVLEYPKNFSGQTGYCTADKLNFPPYDLSMECRVREYISRDLSYETYGVAPLTEADDSITSLARSLVAGKVGKFDKAIALASWIRKNVDYNLGVGDTQETGKWTYYNRIGTCDELSHIFIAFARAVGLTSRYVAGYVYDGEKWLPHAWAEVWTKYGWTPIDIAFDEYGYVDSSHMTVYKGADGDHNFILIHYFGKAVVDHSFSIEMLSSNDIPFITSASVLNSSGGAFALVELETNNPFPSQVALFPKLNPPQNFKLSLVYPQGPLFLEPGKGKALLVMSVQKIKQGYFYTIPTKIYFGPEFIDASFNVSKNYDCSGMNEVIPYTYDTSGCIDLHTGSPAGANATSGDFFCGKCFYSVKEPESRSYSLDYPDFCEDECMLNVDVVGTGRYGVVVNGIKYDGFAHAYKLIKLPLLVGNNTVVVDGVSREISVKAPPEPEISQVLKNGNVCFSSNWRIDDACREVSCGSNDVAVEIKYGSVSRSVTIGVVRSCNVWEKLIYFLKSVWQTK